MIDFHSHLLPHMDDGSKSMEETKQLLVQEYRQGVSKIVVTPHFYAMQSNMEHFLKQRSERLEQVRTEADRMKPMPKLHAGAEVYYFPGIGKAEQIRKLCIEGTQVILLELPFCQWTPEIVKDIKHLMRQQGLTILLAHVERYDSYQKDRGVWNEIMGMPLYLQLNGECFLEWKKRRFGIRLLQEKENVVLGSDCHSLKRRPPNLEEARRVIERKAGIGRLEQIDRLGERILR